MSDPDEIPDADGQSLHLRASRFEIDSCGGWVCLSDATLVEGLVSAKIGDETPSCSGTEGYDGLAAVLRLARTGSSPTTFDGLIFAGEVPPPPSPSDEEERAKVRAGVAAIVAADGPLDGRPQVSHGGPPYQGGWS